MSATPLIANHSAPQYGERNEVFPDIPVSYSHGGGFQHGRMRLQSFIDLFRRDVHACLDNQLLRAADDEYVTILIPVCEIAGVQPPLESSATRGAGRVVVIALHHRVATQQNFAWLSRRQFGPPRGL